MTTQETCGHTATGNGFVFICGRPKEHTGWHEQRTKLRDGVERTNWGDDGKNIWASNDEARRRAS